MSTKRLDVVTFGETMVLMNPDQALPLDYATSFQKQIGGAESNFSVALSRLGHRCGWISQLGDDPFGYYIQRTVRGEGVDTTGVSFTDAAPTGLFFKERRYGDKMNVYYYRHHSAASYMSKDNLDEDYLTSARYLFFSGITPAISKSCKELTFEAVRIAKKNQMPIIFDTNIRKKLWNSEEEMRDVLNKLAADADYILPGQEEGKALIGTDDPEKIAAFYLEQNPNAVVIVKLGEKGCYYAAKEENGFVKGYKAEKVVDPVGAGDGFAAGFVSGLVKGISLLESLKIANLVGAITVQAGGDVEGYPREKELQGMLQAFENPNQEEVNR
ncbi:sugar kinase [Alteribacillus bidgolensis]|uniref:5-dehydro-2-deoxygluconokinase n=1 Tax=Alteribacillus bidgolensis TaxID=930129 RepID=A0A1G8EAN8_9BACI|nr:sugar kinase [Alteribacillus bidgolensis]SDH66917.1 5-dehydro-2-deoxygluconokinase [Alteribacillus bidgolensis]